MQKNRTMPKQNNHIKSKAYTVSNDNVKGKTNITQKKNSNAKSKANTAPKQNDNVKDKTNIAQKKNSNAKSKANTALKQNDNVKGKINIAQKENSSAKSKANTASKQNDNVKSKTNIAQKRNSNAKIKIDTVPKQNGTVKTCLEKSNCCLYASKCGGCDYQGVPYEKQLAMKQKEMEKLLGGFAKVYPIIGMDNPLQYRNKIHAVFDRDRKGNIISGVYEKNSHKVVNVDYCMIQDQRADAIILTIRKLIKDFKMKVYDEDTGYGLFRHVLIRTGHVSGQILVVLVLASPILPAKNNFIKALCAVHPEITSIVLNVNDKKTSMVLGEREIVVYGKGYIEDTLCGLTYRISPKSFYQVNPIQTEKLYQTAIDFAQLTGDEIVLDAYCGIGTIGMTAAVQAKEVIGVELNKDAVKDAIANAKANGIKNIHFYNKDASDFIVDMAQQQAKCDVIFMDPPRSGSTEKFLDCVVMLAPKRVVYVSCDPETLARDLKYITKKGYRVKKIQPVEMFAWTKHVESCVLLCRADT